MGNYKSISGDSSFFKSYDSKEWIILNKNGLEIWKHLEKGNHCLPFNIPNSLSIEDLQRYQFRYLHGYYLVKVIHIVRMKEQSLITQNQNNIVLIQWIIARFSDIEVLKFEEALIVLRSMFKGFSLLYSFYGQFDIQLDMIGVNQMGYVKVWLNTDFNNNQLIQKHQNDSKAKSQMIQNVIKIFSLVEAKVKNGYEKNFKKHLSSLESFIEATNYIQNYLAQNQIHLKSFLNMQTIKLLHKKYTPNENILYPNTNLLHKNYQSHTPKQVLMKEFNLEILNRQKSQSITPKRIKSPNIQIKCKPPTSYFTNIQSRNSQLIRFSQKGITNMSPKPTQANQQNSITPKNNYQKNNNQYLNQQQNFRRNTYMFNEQQIHRLSTELKQEKQKNNFIKNYQSAKIRLPSNLNLKEPKNSQKTSPTSIKNYFTQQSQKNTENNNYKIAQKPQLQHIKPKTMDLNQKKYNKIIKLQKKYDFDDKVETKYQKKKLLIDNWKNSKNKHYKLQCPQQFEVSKSAKKAQSINGYKTQQKLNETLVEDLNTFLEGNKCSLAVNFLQQLKFKQQTVESDVDEMEGSQELKNKLNRIKIDGIIEERKRRQTQNLQNLFELNTDIKHEQTMDNIVSNLNLKKNQNIKNDQKNLHVKINTTQLIKVKSETSSQIKNEGFDEVKKNCQWPKKIKESHDTFYTSNDIYGINAKYDKYVVNKDNKKKTQIIYEQKTTKNFLKLKQGQKSDKNIKKNYMKNKEYFFQ